MLLDQLCGTKAQRIVGQRLDLHSKVIWEQSIISLQTDRNIEQNLKINSAGWINRSANGLFLSTQYFLQIKYNDKSCSILDR